MADDIKIIWNTETFEGDIQFSGGDLVRELGLETAAMMSIFTEQRAEAGDELPDQNNSDLRGWWGDQISDYTDDKIGSKLWLLQRSKTIKDILVKAKTYIENCLQWMIDDEVIAGLEVTTERIERQDGTSLLAASISLKQSDGELVVLKFKDLWTAQLDSVA